MWEPYKKGFKAWLQLEKSLSDNSIEAYLRDIDKLTQYLQTTGDLKSPGHRCANRPAGIPALDRLNWSQCGIAGPHPLRHPLLL